MWSCRVNLSATPFSFIFLYENGSFNWCSLILISAEDLRCDFCPSWISHHHAAHAPPPAQISGALINYKTKELNHVWHVHYTRGKENSNFTVMSEAFWSKFLVLGKNFSTFKLPTCQSVGFCWQSLIIYCRTSGDKLDNNTKRSPNAAPWTVRTRKQGSEWRWNMSSDTEGKTEVKQTCVSACYRTFPSHHIRSD